MGGEVGMDKWLGVLIAVVVIVMVYTQKKKREK